MNEIPVNNFEITIASFKDLELFIVLFKKAIENDYFISNDTSTSDQINKNIIQITSENRKNEKKWISKYILNDIEKNENYFENIEKKLVELLNDVMKSLKTLKTAKGYKLILNNYEINDKQKGAIFSIVTEWLYNEKNVIEKAADLLIRFCQGHYIENGNKRSAIMLVTAFLDQSCIYLYKSYYKEEYIKKWEHLTHEIVDKCEYLFKEINGEKIYEKTNNLLNKEDLYKKVYTYLYSQSYLRLY